MKLTAVGSDYYNVLVNGVSVSQHVGWWKAAQEAIARESANPADVVQIEIRQTVRVEASAPTPPIDPPPPPPPAPDPDPSPAPTPAPIPTAGALQFARHYSTAEGAPTGTSGYFGKHTQWAYCAEDGKLYAYGGDGDWRLPLNNFSPDAMRQSLNSVLSYDFAAGGKFEQLSNQFGSLADGTCPYFHDGCTWVYNSLQDKFYAIPGYQPAYRAAFDPNGIMQADRGKVHMFDRQTRKWSAGPLVGTSWIGEHWGGCFDSKRNRIWIQCAGGSYGRLKFFDCTVPGTFGVAAHQQVSGIAAYPNLGAELVTNPWTQRYNPVTDEIICFDGYRGLVVAISLATLAARVVGRVPALRADTGEPVGTIEAALCISAARQKVFVAYPQQSQYAVGDMGGVWCVDLATGATTQTPYPDPESSWTQAEYDDTNDCLLLMGNILDVEQGKTFMQFKFDAAAQPQPAPVPDPAPAPAPAPVPVPIPAPAASVAWLSDVPLFKWIDIPNSQLTSYFADGGGLNPAYLAELGIALPTKADTMVRWGPNKHGIVARNSQWPWNHHHQSFCGLGFDSGRYSGRPSNLLLGGADAHWADNTVARFVFGVDAPYWEVAVLGCHQREFKNEVPGQDTLGPGDDPRYYRMYDGSDRGGHGYFAVWCIEQRNWHARFGTHQYFPVDAGYSQTVSLADLASKRWLSAELVADWSKYGKGAETPWKGKHPITEDVYMLLNERMVIWRQASNTFDAVELRKLQWGLDDACAGINYRDDYLLCCSRDGALQGRNRWWIFEDNAMRDVMLTGPDGGTILEISARASAIEWHPDLGKFLLYRDDAIVYTLERTDTTTVNVSRLVTTGTPAPAGEGLLRGGGVLNNWQYVPQLKGMIYRVDDRRSVKFLRTG